MQGKLRILDAILVGGLQRLCAGRKRLEEHTSELQSPCNLVCRLLLEKKKRLKDQIRTILRTQNTHILSATLNSPYQTNCYTSDF